MSTTESSTLSSSSLSSELVCPCSGAVDVNNNLHFEESNNSVEGDHLIRCGSTSPCAFEEKIDWSSNNNSSGGNCLEEFELDILETLCHLDEEEEEEEKSLEEEEEEEEDWLGQEEELLEPGEYENVFDEKWEEEIAGLEQNLIGLSLKESITNPASSPTNLQPIVEARLSELDLCKEVEVLDLDELLNLPLPPESNQDLGTEESLNMSRHSLETAFDRESGDAEQSAVPFSKSFADPLRPENERTCLGHKETVFGLAFSDCGQFLATASQDSTVKLWHVRTNKLVTTLKGHDQQYECLRVAWAPPQWGKPLLNRNDQDHILASAGADGTVKLWTSTGTTDYAPFLSFTHPADNEEEDSPQVYALQFIPHWPQIQHEKGLLLTSAHDCIYLWELTSASTVDRFLSFQFVDLDRGYGGVFVHLPDQHAPSPQAKNVDSSSPPSNNSSQAFGGDRNPDNLVFVFDASHCPVNNLLGVALSDGTVRLLNSRGICISILSLPGCQSHLTSLAWDKTGTRLASCVATGHLILWNLDAKDGANNRVVPACVAVLQGGHEQGRPLFGARYCGGPNEQLLLSWGIDGKLILWDSYSKGQIASPLRILVSKSDYPIYAVDVFHQSNKVQIAVGGGREEGFLGVPVFLYDVSEK